MSHMLLIAMLASGALAQWPEDPALNLTVCGRAGEQTLPKIVATSDGGCYISWQDLGSGNYDTYLQRLDADGAPLWQADGLPVSTHPQASWITDYDLAVDQEDCAIVAINDTRAGDDRDITAYRISPDGEFLWGADGLTLSANEGFEPDPRICVTSANNVVFAWQEDTVIHLRKVDSGGADLWDPATITLTAEFTLSIPRLAPAPGDGVLLQFLAAQGSQMWSPKHLVIQRFDNDGQTAWDGLGVAIQTAGGFGPQMRPDLKADGAGGAWCFWYDSRNNQLHAYAQHLLESGVPAWTANGVLLSATATELQDQPRLIVDETGDGPAEIELFYRITDQGQNQMGIAGQRLSATGERLWGNGGLLLHPLAGQDRHSVVAVRGESDTTLVGHLEFPVGDVVNSRLIVQAVAGDGQAGWNPALVTASSTLSPRGNLAATINSASQLLATWRDQRDEASGNILAQNVNPDGSLGPWQGTDLIPAVTPASLRLLSCWPNPFNPTIAVELTLPRGGPVLLVVHDLLGREVARLVDEFLPAGQYRLIWDAAEQSSGTYYLVVRAGALLDTQALTLLR